LNHASRSPRAEGQTSQEGCERTFRGSPTSIRTEKGDSLSARTASSIRGTFATLARAGTTRISTAPQRRPTPSKKIKAAERHLGIGQEKEGAHHESSPFPEHAPKFETHAVAVHAIALSDAAGDVGGAPEWIMVIPAGQFSGR